jgi:hypothetical protein
MPNAAGAVAVIAGLAETAEVPGLSWTSKACAAAVNSSLFRDVLAMGSGHLALKCSKRSPLSACGRLAGLSSVSGRESPKDPDFLIRFYRPLAAVAVDLSFRA